MYEYANGGPEECQTKKASQIECEVEGVFASLDRLGKSLDKLMAMTEPLRDTRPKPQAPGGHIEKEEYLVPLAARIRDLSRQANRLNDIARQIISEIEL